jgi:ketopantoate reductase
MRICIFGSGAIGGLLAARLASVGEDVTVIGRGPQLDAMQKNGIELRWQDGSVQAVKMKAVDKATAAGEQDLVILAVKAHSLEQVANDIQALLGPRTMIMTLQNGMPWWYFQKHGGPLDGRRLESLDPSGLLSRSIDQDRIIGCAVYLAAEVAAPGIVRHVEANRFPLGELDGAVTDRARAVETLFLKAGLNAQVVTDIRAELWLKALGTLSFNPISALTRATMAEICALPETRQLAVKMMKEAQTIAGKLGITLSQTIEQRLARAEAVGAHKTSMLQDAERGRPLETEALVGAILEMARLTGTPAPTIEAVYALIKLLDRQMQHEGSGFQLALERDSKMT